MFKALLSREKTEGIFMAEAATVQKLDFGLVEAHEFVPNLDLGPALVMAIPEMVEDTVARTNAASFIGSVLAGNYVETNLVKKPIFSLQEAINRAAEGDREAYKLVEVNVSTDVVERTIKTGIVMHKVPVEMSANSQPSQYGQSFDSIQANSLRLMAGHEIMEARTKAETNNAFRIKSLYEQGYLEDHSLVVFSLAEDLPEIGFFTETMSCAIQVTTKDGDGLSTEPAFVSGIKIPNGVRHDEETVVKIYDRFDVDIGSKSRAEIIDTPLLVHNSLIPNGAIDLVSIWDDCAGGTFFGEDKPRQNYLEYKKDYCEVRQASFKPKIDLIVNQLLSEASSISGPVMATKRLHKISEQHMVDYAIADTSINARAFGTESAEHIEMARLYQRSGDFQAADNERQRAMNTANSSSCPNGVKSSSSSDSAETSGESDEFGSQDFLCPKGHLNYRQKHRLLDRCRSCGISVSCK
jgi:hypothetical protein